MLLPLVLSVPSADTAAAGAVGRDGAAAPDAASFPLRRRADPPISQSVPCAFCGVRSGRWQRRVRADGAPACPLCALSLHLDRPQIDDEAVLAWLPEISQAAINRLLRHVHIQLRNMGEAPHFGARLHAVTPDRRVLYAARATLHERTAAAASRLGTSLPSELASALLHLSRAARAAQARLLGGLRLLPLGRFYAEGEDVYPAILDAWLKPGRSLGGAQAPAGAR